MQESLAAGIVSQTTRTRHRAYDLDDASRTQTLLSPTEFILKKDQLHERKSHFLRTRYMYI